MVDMCLGLNLSTSGGGKTSKEQGTHPDIIQAGTHYGFVLRSYKMDAYWESVPPPHPLTLWVTFLAGFYSRDPIIDVVYLAYNNLYILWRICSM